MLSYTRLKKLKKQDVDDSSCCTTLFEVGGRTHKPVQHCVEPTAYFVNFCSITSCIYAAGMTADILIVEVVFVHETT